MTRGYIDEFDEPVFVEDDEVSHATSVFMYSQGERSHIHAKRPPRRNAEEYIKTKAKIPRIRETSIKDKDGNTTFAYERIMADATRMPVYITKSRINLGADKEVIQRQSQIPCVDNSHSEITGLGDDDLTFRSRHEISYDWLFRVCNDEIEL